jgi:hypothetical protein
MIHYHGTPITPRAKLETLAGYHFCVSFADKRDGEWCVANGQSVMFDNGAYVAFKQKKTFNMTKYSSWLEPLLGHPHWAVIPDVIDGTEDEQRSLIKQWTHPKELSAPVWHLGLSVNYLLELSDNWPKICFGSSRQYWQVGSSLWCSRVDEAFTALSKRHTHLPWVHMLRGLAQAGKRWPFASADSVNVARNYKSAKKEPEEMIKRIDAIQTPVKWVQP